VLLLEKAELPRYKTCGGGIIGPSRDALPPGFELPLRDRVHAVTFSLNGRLSRTRRSRQMLFGLINRPEFDARLVDAAVDAGARLRTGASVSRIEQHGTSVPDRRTVAVVLNDGETILARAVVGADGSASRIGAHVGVKMAQVDLGLEAEIPVPAQVAEDWAGRVLIDWGPLPGSYGWVFPKGDTLTVGVIGSRDRGEAVRAYYRDFLRRLGLDASTALHDGGHLTRVRAAGSPVRRGSVLVAGDAAGLLEPWTREGISFALRSGALAGQAAATDPTSYDDAVAAALGPDMAAGRRALAVFERHPGTVHTVFRHLPGMWELFVRLVSGETSMAEQLSRRRIRGLVTVLGG
jgi:geranylgeranyl reductase family protein